MRSTRVRRGGVVRGFELGGKAAPIALDGKSDTPLKIDEKFMDPLYLVWGNGPYRIASLDALSASPRLPGLGPYLFRFSMGNDQNDVKVGLEYLAGVEALGVSRVAAMRQQINKKSKTPSGSILPSIVEQSRDTMFKIGNSMASIYTNVAANAKAASDAAEQLGIEPALVKNEADAMLASAKSLHDVQLLEAAAKKYGPIAQATIKGIASVIAVATSGSGDKETAVSVLNGIADASLSIPGYGVFISASLRLISGSLQSNIDAAREMCRQDIAEIKTWVDRAASLGMPIPWHGYEIFDVLECPADGGTAEGWDSTDDQKSAFALFQANFKNWENMPSGARLAALRWWGVAQLYMSNTKVSEVFAALGFDARGGTIASDEQVMLVAAPIAVANGIDVDVFAAKLWDSAPGWRSAPDALVSKAYCLATGDKYGYPTGCNIPNNAWWVQWGVLADRAFQLADEMRGNTLLSILHIPGGVGGESSVLTKVAVPAAIGVAAGFAATSILGASGPVGWAVGIGAAAIMSLFND